MSDAMTDWTKYSQDKESIEYELRLKISDAIQRKINIAKESNISNHFLLGLELANAVVLDRLNDALDEEEENLLF